MDRIKFGLMVLAALIIAALLTLFFQKRDVYLRWTLPAAPAGNIAEPAMPAVEPVKEKKRVLKQSAAGPGLSKAAAAAGKPGKKRKKRVSPLREPGEALGGGVRLDLPDKTTDMTLLKK
ncbi:MAG: hypothetical protein PHV36_07195 [Elusimicrobiales bacterium]|nr:hypothetical protein [Elusimicrobiales bacterium]